MVKYFDMALYPVQLCVIVTKTYSEAIEECRENFVNKDGSAIEPFGESEEYNIACEMLAYKTAADMQL